MIRRYFNLVRVGFCIVGFSTEAYLGKLLIRDHLKKRRHFIETTSKWCGHIVKILGVQIELKNFDSKHLAEKNYLFVCNHMSYLDILVFSSVIPTMFVTSVEMRSAFFLGTMAELGGSLFIERRLRSRLEQDISALSDGLNQGFHVMVYPEGTSTDGSTVQPFKKSLLISAISAGRDIMPICIRYKEIDGEVFSTQNHARVCWYGDMTFGPHFLQLAKVKKLKVSLEFLPIIEVHSGADRREIGEAAFTKIHSAYHRKEVEL